MRDSRSGIEPSTGLADPMPAGRGAVGVSKPVLYALAAKGGHGPLVVRISAESSPPDRGRDLFLLSRSEYKCHGGPQRLWPEAWSPALLRH